MKKIFDDYIKMMKFVLFYFANVGGFFVSIAIVLLCGDWLVSVLGSQIGSILWFVFLILLIPLLLSLLRNFWEWADRNDLI